MLIYIRMISEGSCHTEARINNVVSSDLHHRNIYIFFNDFIYNNTNNNSK